MKQQVDKGKVRKLFVRLINTISTLKRFDEAETMDMGRIGAYQLRITQLEADPVAKHEDEIDYYLNAIEAEEINLRSLQADYRDYKEGSEVCHQELMQAAFVEQEAGILYHFLLPYHSTFGHRTLVPGFNSMALADIDTIEFIEVHRTLDADKQGAYLVYPTMGNADFGVIV